MSTQNTELLEIINQLKQKFPMFFMKGDLWVNTLNLEDQNRINSIIRWTGAQNYSPLRMALHIGSQELMKLLIDQGLRLTEKEERAEKVNPHIDDYFRYLLEKCDKVDEMSSEDRAVWLEIRDHEIRDHEDVEDIETLLKTKKVNINAVDSSGKTLLHIAAEKSVPRAIEILIENGAIVDARDNLNLTPLCYAIKNNETNSISLVEHGADPNVLLDGVRCNVYTNAWDPRRKREFDNAVCKMSNTSVPSSNGNAQISAQLLGKSLSQVTNVASPSSVPKTEHHQSHKSPAFKR
jgi:ankyrin repeat protein